MVRHGVVIAGSAKMLTNEEATGEGHTADFIMNPRGFLWGKSILLFFFFM